MLWPLAEQQTPPSGIDEGALNPVAAPDLSTTSSAFRMTGSRFKSASYADRTVGCFFRIGIA